MFPFLDPHTVLSSILDKATATPTDHSLSAVTPPPRILPSLNSHTDTGLQRLLSYTWIAFQKYARFLFYPYFSFSHVLTISPLLHSCSLSIISPCQALTAGAAFNGNKKPAAPTKVNEGEDGGMYVLAFFFLFKRQGTWTVIIHTVHRCSHWVLNDLLADQSGAFITPAWSPILLERHPALPRLFHDNFCL